MSTASLDRFLAPNPFWLTALRNFSIPGAFLAALKPEQIQLVQRAINHVQKREVVEATQVIGILAQGIPAASDGNIIVDILRAITAVTNNQSVEALAIFERQSQEHPDNNDLQMNYVTGLLASGDLLRGAQVLEQMAVREPTLESLLVPMTVVSGLLQRHETAELWARRARAAGKTAGSDLVGLVLMQSTLMLGRPQIEGACQFNAGQDSNDPAVIDQLLQRLPPVKGDAWRHGIDRPTLFVAADPVYYKQHVMPLLWSVLDTNSPCVVHVHLYNPTPELLIECERLRARLRPFPLRFTYEELDFTSFGGLGVYASNARFCRLYQLLMANNAPVICLDADMLVRKDLAEIEGLLDPKCSVGLTDFPDEPAWNRYAAGFTYFKPTAFGQQFLRRVATLVGHNLLHRTGRWFLDQIALFEAVWANRDQDEAICHLEGDEVCDLKHSDASQVWAITLDKNSPRYVQYRDELQQKYLSCTTYLDYRVETVKSTYGPMMILPGDKYIGPSIKHLGTWCKNELDLLKQIVPVRGVVVDGGANMGSHAIAFGQFVGPGGRVLSFEPQRLIYYVLAGNIALNGMTQVEAYNCGLGDKPGTLGIGAPIEGQNFGAVRLVPGQGSPYVETITIRTLDSFQLDRCDVIKLDIEGMELEAMQGARETVEKFQPILYLENHEGPKCQPLIDLVCGHGYRAYWHGVETHNPNLLCIHRSRPIRVDGLREALPSQS